MTKSLLKLSENRGSIGDRFRAKRFQFFQACIEDLKKPVTILDLGGTESFWVNRGLADKEDLRINLLNLHKVEVKSSNMTSLKGDATDLRQFQDNEFDIVFSNSVIEHLYTFENQKKMASESIRVGVYHFIQTPNKYFFIEPHFQFPFFNRLPRWLAFRILTKTKLSLGQRWRPENANTILNEIRLLSKKEFQSLYSDSTLYIERFLLTQKSFTLHNFVKD